MINIQAKVYDTLSTYIKTQQANIFTSSVEVQSPPSFPCVFIIEAENSVNTNYTSNSGIEEQANVMYEIKIYSSLRSGAKQEALKIAEYVDYKMASLGFTRITKTEVPNIDSSASRVVLRYNAVVSKKHTITENNTTTDVYYIHQK